MKIYDISQEVFSCEIYPGDPSPKRERLCAIESGDLYNLTAFSMCAHNGTHIDAPSHFIPNGSSVDAVDLSKTVGYAFVVEHNGDVFAEDAEKMLERAREICGQSARRILIKGDVTVTSDAARVFAEAKLELLGNESQTVGPDDAPMEVHKILLSADTVLLEGIRLGEVPEGLYILCAQPLNLAESDGSPCRAILIEF